MLISWVSMKWFSYLTESMRTSSLSPAPVRWWSPNDLGMMRYFPQVWASDNTDAIAVDFQSSMDRYL